MNRLNEEGTPAADVLAELREARRRDFTFESGRILGSMCTAPHPIGAEAHRLFLETNLGDPLLFPGARDLEVKAMEMVGSFLGAGPQGSGVFVTGGSEANFTALRMAVKRSGKREVVLPRSAHFSFDKTVDYLGLVPRFADTLPDGTVDVDHVRRLIGPDTAAIVGIAGTTELGVVDDIPALSELAVSRGVHLHVDAAWGGFVIPFAKRLGHKVPDFDLALPGVATLTVDPHKMGLAPVPAGILLSRDAAYFQDISIPSPYVSVEKQPTLQGTRSGAAAAATYAVLRHLGWRGYQDVVAECFRVARLLDARLRAMGAQVAR
ncbi:MAG TPA: tyrosine decarboxylase MfnA, partial [Candidatus Thermoplasmatota archaeon]|nr:tyrosine decarboxylase MfnA [Candidatus Thermoplasmatota archaeon]